MEILDIVDEDGVPTGKTVEREKAHTLGIRHRTSHVWLYRKCGGKTQLLLQKRCRSKDSFPGCYDISSAGHIPAGDGFTESALRELYEELGVEAETDELVFCGLRRSEFRESFHGRDFWDRQVSGVYVLRRETGAEEFSVQASEIESVAWTDWDACTAMARSGVPANCVRLDELEMIAHAVGERV